MVTQAANTGMNAVLREQQHHKCKKLGVECKRIIPASQLVSDSIDEALMCTELKSSHAAW